jgi:hypothetical protein
LCLGVIYSSLRTGSLKIRPPEFTPAAWVRDIRITRFKSEKQRLAFHVKHWLNAGGRIFNEPYPKNYA